MYVYLKFYHANFALLTLLIVGGTPSFGLRECRNLRHFAIKWEAPDPRCPHDDHPMPVRIANLITLLRAYEPNLYFLFPHLTETLRPLPCPWHHHEPCALCSASTLA